MFVGEHRAGEEWVDFTRSHVDPITIGDDGFAVFTVHAGGVSVWAHPDVD